MAASRQRWCATGWSARCDFEWLPHGSGGARLGDSAPPPWSGTHTTRGSDAAPRRPIRWFPAFGHELAPASLHQQRLTGHLTGRRHALTSLARSVRGGLRRTHSPTRPDGARGWRGSMPAASRVRRRAASRRATPHTSCVPLRRPLDGGPAPPLESPVLFPNVASAVLPISEEITACPLFSKTSVARGDVST